MTTCMIVNHTSAAGNQKRNATDRIRQPSKASADPRAAREKIYRASDEKGRLKKRPCWIQRLLSFFYNEKCLVKTQRSRLDILFLSEGKIRLLGYGLATLVGVCDQHRHTGNQDQTG